MTRASPDRQIDASAAHRPGLRQPPALRALARWIGERGLGPGDRLPSERTLMDGLGVGRSSLREAIGHLSALAVVDVRRGSGTFLTRAIDADTVYLPLAIDATRTRLLQTLDVRRALEAEASALAARRADARALEIVEARLVAMERAHHGRGTSGPEDLAFHRAVFDASGNPLFDQLLGQLRDAFLAFWDQPFDRADFGRASFPFHRRLFDAIAAGDEARARRHTLAILDSVERDVREMSREQGPIERPVERPASVR